MKSLPINVLSNEILNEYGNIIKELNKRYKLSENEEEKKQIYKNFNQFVLSWNK